MVHHAKGGRLSLSIVVPFGFISLISFVNYYYYFFVLFISVKCDSSLGENAALSSNDLLRLAFPTIQFSFCVPFVCKTAAE
jgi:hypothetical protein